jgi:hypothetical protein
MNQISDNPFEKSLLMIEIEKRDLEIKSLKEQLNLSSSSLSLVVSQLQSTTKILEKSLKISDEDWGDLLNSMNSFNIQLNDLNSFRQCLDCFFVLKASKHV